MSRPHSESLERRKQVRLRARPNLQSVCRFQGGRRVHVVKDPIALQYFHLEEAHKFALDRMDGNHTLAQIQQEYESEHKPQRLTLEELEGFASQLLHAGLVETETASAGQLMVDRVEKQQGLQQWAWLARVFYFKLPVLQSTRWLDKLVPIGRLLFHPMLVLLGAVFLVGSVGMVVTRWSEFLDRLPGYQDLFTVQGMLYLWLAIGLVKIIHELGHTLCARTLGCDVHEVGVAVTFFFPTLYCNVSDSWMLPEKWKRIAIAAAGMYVELLTAGCAVWIWWGALPGTFVHQLSFWLTLTCSVHTILFNANPLMRFDGYFIFSDWLDIPNLSQNAQRQFSARLLGWLGYETPKTLPGPKQFLFAFGMASFVYRCFILASMLYLFHQFMKELRLEWLGVSLVFLAVAALVSWPGYRLWHMLGQLRKVSPMKPVRFWLSAILVAAAMAVFFLVPFPIHVRGVGLVQVELAHQQPVVIPAPGGFLIQKFAKDGQQVRQGDILAVLRNPRVNLDLRLIEADLALRGDQLQAILGQQAILEGAGAEWGTRTELQQELHTLAQRQSMLKARADDLILRAPCDGTLMGFPGWEAQGRWLVEGTQFCQIGDQGNLRLVILLEPADRQLVEVGKPLRFRCHGMSGVTWHGKVSGAAQVDARDMPVQLSHRLGGSVASKPDAVNKMEKPDKQQFLVSAKLDDVDDRLQVGTLGQIRIEVGSETCWWRVQRYLGSTFRWRF